MKKLEFLLIFPLRPRGGGALVDMFAKKEFFFGRLPLRPRGLGGLKAIADMFAKNVFFSDGFP